MRTVRVMLNLIPIIFVSSFVSSCGLGKVHSQSEDVPQNGKALPTPTPNQIAGKIPKATPPAGQSALASVKQVSLGGGFSCVVMTTSGVKCWGSNLSGEIGDNTSSQTLRPVSVPGLSNDVSEVSSGERHTCVLTTNGGVKCLGENRYGQLGNDTTTNSSHPVNVTGLSGGVKAISSGSEHACALTMAGAVKCWGNNSLGQLGDNTTTARSTPVDVDGLGSGVIAISAGGSHTCAIAANGGVKCWGSNFKGELGDGTTTQRLTPTNVSGLASGTKAISTGKTAHTCALTTTGGVKCWGFNDEGRLGDNTDISRSTPVDVTGLTSGVMAIASGGYHTCALTTNGGVKCWGSNTSGKLGDKGTVSQPTPTDVVDLSKGVTGIASGKDHTCASLSTGELKCWGKNAWGQLGDGTETDRAAPVEVAFP